MRLTPFRDNSSSDSSGDESTVQASTSIRVFNYDESSVVSHETESKVAATEVPPEIEWAVVSLLNARGEPVTIDEVADEIHGADRMDDVEAWGDVHERLSETDLPALEASGTIEFHPDRGTVTLVEHRSSRFRDWLLAATLAAGLGLVLAPLLFGVTVLVSVLGALVAGVGIAATVGR